MANSTQPRIDNIYGQKSSGTHYSVNALSVMLIPVRITYTVKCVVIG